jgi:prevent-host-death family protein
MDISVRELKAKLSEMLDRAERGELVRVTDRGRPKALLGPLPGKVRLEQGVEEGWITRGTGGPLPPVLRVRAAPGSPTSDIILEDDRGR